MSPAGHTGHRRNRQPSSLTEGTPGGWIVRIRDLYEGDTPQAHRFRYGLLIFDVTTILFIVATSFLPRIPLIEVLDTLFGLAILADIAARMLISRHRWRDLLHPLTLIDLVVATVLMSMGMMMMPPMVISLPLKILLFVLVDGWGLIVRSLVTSFGL